MAGEKQRLRWGFVGLWTAVGMGIVAVATHLANGWADSNYWSSVLVNLGTTVLLAGFLVWLERRFVVTAQRVAAETATVVATEAATTVAQEATRNLSARLDSLQDRLQGEREERARQQDSAVAALSSEASRAAVVTALSTAADVGASTNRVFVTAGSGPDAPVVAFELVVPDDEEDDLGLQLLVETGNGWHRTIEWPIDEDPVRVLAHLETEIMRAGQGDRLRSFQADRLFSLLHAGLRDAIAGRRGDADAWRSTSTLLDVIDEDWIVSEVAVEHRLHGAVIGSEAYPQMWFQGTIRPGTQPPRPEWVDEQTWGWVLRRGRLRLEKTTSPF